MTRRNQILPNLIGGLGNQLFIASAAYAVGKLHSCPVYLCNATDNAHNTIGHDYRTTILKGFGEIIPRTLQQLIESGECTDCKIYSHPDFMPWNPFEVTPPVVMYGYYQHLGHIEEFEDEIREKLLTNLDPIRQELLSNTNLNFKTTAFIHVRRGDYVGKSHFHYLQPIEYYQQAIDYIKTKGTIEKILIFSDDTSWIKEQDFFNNLEGAILVNEPDELRAMSLMSLCEAGAVCANSTFSWWGAFLCSKIAPICVPERWINAKVIHLFPSSWKVIYTP